MSQTNKEYDIRFCFGTLTPFHVFDTFNRYEKIKFNGTNYVLLSSSICFYHTSNNKRRKTKIAGVYDSQLVIEL